MWAWPIIQSVVPKISTSIIPQFLLSLPGGTFAYSFLTYESNTCPSLWRRANAGMISFRNSLRRTIYTANPVDKIKLSCYSAHRRSATVSSEAYFPSPPLSTLYSWYFTFDILSVMPLNSCSMQSLDFCFPIPTACTVNGRSLSLLVAVAKSSSFSSGDNRSFLQLASYSDPRWSLNNGNAWRSSLLSWSFSFVFLLCPVPCFCMANSYLRDIVCSEGNVSEFQKLAPL